MGAMSDDPAHPADPGAAPARPPGRKQADRFDRRAAALRENLRRRKQQQRTRTDGDGGTRREVDGSAAPADPD